jgi:YggT family protein
MGQNFASAGIYLIQTFFGLYILVIMLRFLIQAARADFYNPISQGIVKITDPALRPLRRVIPGFRNFDLSSILLALVVQILTITLIFVLYGASIPGPLTLFLWSSLGLFSLTLMLIHQIVEPICAPARKLLPPMGGLDFSIILVFVFITLVDSFLVVKPLQVMLGIPSGLILGL